MLTTAWRRITPTSSDHDYEVVLTELRVKRLRLWQVMRYWFRKAKPELSDAEGIVGFSVAVASFGSRYLTLTAWNTKAAMASYLDEQDNGITRLDSLEMLGTFYLAGGSWGGDRMPPSWREACRVFGSAPTLTERIRSGLRGVGVRIWSLWHASPPPAAPCADGRPLQDRAAIPRTAKSQGVSFIVRDDKPSVTPANQWPAGADHTGEKITSADLRCLDAPGALLQRAQLGESDFTCASLRDARFEGADLRSVNFAGADLRGAWFDEATDLDGLILQEGGQAAWLADVHWKGAPLMNIDWSNVTWLGDELGMNLQWHAIHMDQTLWVSRNTRVAGWGAAERAYRQLSVELKNHGLREPADRFSYRADIMRRKALGATGPRAWLSWLGSAFLWAVVGYGFRPIRCVGVYLGVVAVFASAYAAASRGSQHQLDLRAAITLSVLAFHGRGIVSDPFGLRDLVTSLTAAEAIVGLLLEVTFIAALTRRLFGS